MGFGEDKNNRSYSRAANTMKQMVAVVELFHQAFPLRLSIFFGYNEQPRFFHLRMKKTSF